MFTRVDERNSSADFSDAAADWNSAWTDSNSRLSWYIFPGFCATFGRNASIAASMLFIFARAIGRIFSTSSSVDFALLNPSTSAAKPVLNSAIRLFRDWAEFSSSAKSLASDRNFPSFRESEALSALKIESAERIRFWASENEANAAFISARAASIFPAAFSGSANAAAHAANNGISAFCIFMAFVC